MTEFNRSKEAGTPKTSWSTTCAARPARRGHGNDRLTSSCPSWRPREHGPFIGLFGTVWGIMTPSTPSAP
ncbi:MAG: hypothetical protein ACLSAH_01655 [Bilophila wadsworthia]